MAFGIMSASAQTKIGYINTDELMAVMPEAAKIQSDLAEYQTSLQQQGITLQKEADAKRDQYFIDSVKLSPSMKEIRRNDLVKLYSRLQNYDQEAQEESQKYAQTKIAPVRTKALEAIKTVARERLPECQDIVVEADDLLDLWIQLDLVLARAYREPESLDEALIGSIYDYASWCLHTDVRGDAAEARRRGPRCP